MKKDKKDLDDFFGATKSQEKNIQPDLSEQRESFIRKIRCWNFILIFGPIICVIIAYFVWVNSLPK